MRILILLLCCCFSSVVLAKKKPNFIIIFTDDMGYADLQCFGAPKTKTPHLDKMAAEGMKMTNFHVASPVCSPSRGALMAGRYPHRMGIANGVFRPGSKKGLPIAEITIAEILKEKNYNSAIIGKWHLGHRPNYLPTNQGFDYFYGIPYSNDMYMAADLPLSKNIVLNDGVTLQDVKDLQADINKNRNKYGHAVPVMRNNKVVEFPCDQATFTKRLTTEAVQYIGKNKKKPFFLYMAHPMPHTPIYASPAFKGKSANGLYGDVIEEVDWSVGQILKALKDNGIEKNTYVIFTSDNGPWLIKRKHGGSSGKFRNGKGSNYEGGMRVPCIVKYPAGFKGGQTSSTFASTMDLLPTIAELAGISLKHKVDGHSMVPIMKNAHSSTSYDYFLYTHSKGALTGIIQGDWKLLFSKPNLFPLHKKALKRPFEGLELYNLSTDLGEDKNLAKSYPEKVKQLKALAIKQFKALKDK